MTLAAGSRLGPYEILAPLFGIHPGGAQPFDVSADGRRLLVNAGPADPGSPPFSLVLNWRGLLKKD